MASFFKYLLRALKKMTTGTPSSTAERKTMPSHKLVFPTSMFKPDKLLTKKTLDTYRPSVLLDSFLDRAVESVDSIRVTSLSYHKETYRAGHEYLVIKVEDTKYNCSNFIKIDRCPPKGEELALPPQPSDNAACTFRLATEDDVLSTSTSRNSRRSRLGSSFVNSSSSSSGGVFDSLGNPVTQDRFHVSTSGTLESVQVKKSKRLATVHFRTNTPTLVQLLILANIVSESQPEYQLFQTQCYWYAFTIWEVLKLEFPNPGDWPRHHNNTGKHKLIPWIEWHKRSLKGAQANTAQEELIHTHTSLADKYRVALADFMKEIKKIQDELEGKARAQEDAAQANTRTQARNEELEENALRHQAKEKEWEENALRHQAKEKEWEENALRHQAKEKEWEEEMARARAMIMELGGKLAPAGGQGD